MTDGTKRIKDEYRALLDRSYAYYIGRVNLKETSPSRLDFVGKAIFGFHTHDDTAMTYFAAKAVQIVAALLARSTRAYLQSMEIHLWYLALMNMPFFAERVSWKGTIRDAFFEASYNHEFTSDYLVDEQGKAVYGGTGWSSEIDGSCPMYFHENQWELFMQAVVEFATTQPNEASVFDSADSTWMSIWLTAGANLRLIVGDFSDDADDDEKQEWVFKVKERFNLTEVHLELLKALCPTAEDYGEPGNLYSGTYLTALCQELIERGLVEDAPEAIETDVDVRIHFAVTTDVDLAIYKLQPTAAIVAAFRKG